MSRVTLFGYPKRVISVQPLLTFISKIKRGNYEDIIERFRDMHFRELDTLLESQRRQIPKFSIAGNFKSDSHHLKLINYSGYLFFEIKYLHPKEYENVRSLLYRNPYVFASFKNTLGHGICFILKSEEGIESHTKIFRRAYGYFENKLGTKRLSKAGEDLQHLCTMSFDLRAQVNIASIPFPLRAQIKY
jgi:hypothetical protein